MRIQVDKDELMELKKNGVAKTKAKSKNAPLFKDSDNIRAEDENQDLYNKCMLYWESLSGFRKRMKRNRKYYRGDQWHELIQDPESGDMITEETFIRNQGRIPFKQNMIRQMVNNMLGQYRANTTKPLVVAVNSKDSAINDMMNNAIRGVHNLNDIDSLDTRNFESFLLSGAAIGKVTTTYFPEKDRKDIFYQNVNPSRIFFNPDVEDIRLNDLHTIGEIVDTTIDSVITSFAKNKKQEQEIRDHYQSMDGQNGLSCRRSPMSFGPR